MSEPGRQASCEERVAAQLQGRLDDLRTLWRLYCEGNEEGDEDLGNFHEYGLAFDYVGPDTFKDQEEGYFRYQLSWGGPGDEFRFFVSGPRFEVHRIEYCFLDWWDGASRRLYGEDRELMEEIFDFFREIGTVEHLYNEAYE